MKIIAYVIWFSVFLLVYGSVNYYIGLRGWQAFPKNALFTKAYIITFIFVALSYFASRIIENFSVCMISGALFWIGSFWFGFMLYFFTAAVFFDIIRLSSHLFNFYPSFIINNYDWVKTIIAVSVIILSAVIQISGYDNACRLNIREISMSVPKKAGAIRELRIAFASDIHLGTIIKNARLERMVTAINGMNPDVIILGGDVFDEDLKPVLHYNLGDILKNLKARYGTYAVSGNHEYYGGIDEAVAYLENHGIRVLRDRVVKIDDSFYIAGADDHTKQQFTGISPLPFRDLLKDVDMKLPVILPAHNPKRVREAEESGADLMLSGHTHNGQLWPITYITKTIYEISYGYRKFGDMHVYVSSGYGSWGPPARVGTETEVALIKIKLAED
ncbi:MAG: metallophosphoesterase [Spirochaetes bacterium]|nr:metallophosphoesterase [Spirochaetota bacterium]